jgi:hypothetical protein
MYSTKATTATAGGASQTRMVIDQTQGAGQARQEVTAIRAI